MKIRIPSRKVLCVLVAILPAPVVLGQNSFPLADIVPLARGGSLGNQALAGDLLAAGIDPTVARGERFGLEVAAGSHVLDLDWGAAGLRFKASGHEFALVFSTLSYGQQQRTGFDDRLGIFGGTFTPSDWNISMATVLLAEEIADIGIGLTISHAQLDDAKAMGLSGAVAVKRRFADLEIRGGLSNLGTVYKPFDRSDGTRMPARARAGAAYLFPGRQWEIASEALYRFGEGVMGWGVGTEWKPLPEAALRVGLVGGDAGTAFSEGILGDLGLTAGLAWRFADWRLSYSYRPGGVLGDGHLIAVGWGLEPAR